MISKASRGVNLLVPMLTDKKFSFILFTYLIPVPFFHSCAAATLFQSFYEVIGSKDAPPGFMLYRFLFPGFGINTILLSFHLVGGEI